MFVAVIGGKLQGVEATYLGQKAGWKVVVVDGKAEAPASGFCDAFVELDIRREKDLEAAVANVDLVIPALEDDEALAVVERWAERSGIPCAFDARAYSVASSKTRSNRMFSKIGLPMPEPWPGCGFPVLAKPSRGSGSAGVQVLHDSGELGRRLSNVGSTEDWILQGFLDGPLYSLEVIGSPGRYRTLQVTDLAVDASYDCKRVSTPTELDDEAISEFEEASLAIAEALELRGLIDVEVVSHEGALKALEVDARLPSQTPTAVYWSSGVNMVRLLGELFVQGSVEPDRGGNPALGAVCEHVRVSPPLLEIVGEHVMAQGGPLHVRRDFFGADEAITNYLPGREEWVAMLIVSGADRKDAWARRCRVVAGIQERFGLDACLDPSPEDVSERPARE